MLEYKVVQMKVKEAEEQMNALAREGWRVVSVIIDCATLSGSVKGMLLVTMERQRTGAQLF